MPFVFFNVGVREKISLAVRSFSKTWKIIFFGLIFVFAASGAGILSALNSILLVPIPEHGGGFSEGIVGSPRFINPVLAASDADKDLTALVYSGLMRISGDGTLIPDLAESYSISPDGKEYTFVLKPEVIFHDGTPVTSEDVKFTIEKIKDPQLKSPRRGNWEGVQVSAPDSSRIVFTLALPYAPFLGNTTLGIMPASAWENLSAEEWNSSALNMKPVGSGPYQIKEVQQNASVIPEYYDLVSFPDFALGEPYIESLRLYFYANEDELLAGIANGEAESHSAVSPERAILLEGRDAQALRAPLPRVFGIFFNQNEQDLFTDPSVRRALDKSVDRDYIIDTIFHGSATPLSGPFPPGTYAYHKDDDPESSVSAEERRAEAREILLKGGWKQNEETRQWQKKEKNQRSIEKTLSFSLSTSDAPELKSAAESVKRDFEALGARVDLKIFEAGDLNQNVIRPRKYEALLFGEIIGRDPDPYAFWHSSQRLDPGLNIALYANVTADKTLEKIREAFQENRAALYREFEEKIKEDVPAIFLYSPQFIYILPSRIENAALPPIVYPAERFSEIYRWNIEKDKVWKIFAP